MKAAQASHHRARPEGLHRAQQKPVEHRSTASRWVCKPVQPITTKAR